MGVPVRGRCGPGTFVQHNQANMAVYLFISCFIVALTCFHGMCEAPDAQQQRIEALSLCAPSIGLISLLIVTCACVGIAFDFLQGYWYWRQELKDTKPSRQVVSAKSYRRTTRRGSFVTSHGPIPRATQSFEDAHTQPEEDHKLPSIVLSRLTFKEWIYYWMTLRLEHLYDKSIQFGCYLWYKWTGLLDRTVSEKEAQRLLLNHVWTQSSLVCYTGTEKVGRSDESYVFEFKNASCPVEHQHKPLHNKLFIAVVKVPLRTLQVRNGEVVRGECSITVNDEPCTATDFYALYYFGFVGGFIHPKIHCMASWISQYKYDSPVFNQMHVFTTMMNDTGQIAGNVMTNENKCPASKVMKESLTQNIENGMWDHKSMTETFGEGTQHESRYVTFVVKARAIVAKVCRRENLRVHPEILLLGSVLHSLDHNLLYKTTSWTSLLRSVKFGVDARLFAFLFINATRGWWVNTRMRDSSEPWIRKVHRALHSVDPEYADLIHYCISW